MKKSMKIYVTIIAILTLIASCKDPREKTVWDYIGDDQTVSMERFEDGIEEMHKDLIKHGYMKKHDCREMECAKYHTTTNGDIERINSLMADNSNTNKNHSSYSTVKKPFIQEKKFVKEFPEHGFSIETPCPLKDVSEQSDGDFLVNYAGTTNENDEKKFAFYQVMVTRLPVGYNNLSASEREKMIDRLLEEATYKSESAKPIRFSYDNYKGYEMTSHHNGYKQKGVIFSKENLFICLTVISNDRLDEKFNKFTNGFKTIQTIKSNNNTIETEKSSGITNSLVYGYKINAPCKLLKEQDYRYDYAYKGVVETANPDNAVVYMALIVDLPMKFSEMIESDKAQIKSNLMEYLKSKGKYEKATLNTTNIFAYNVSFREDGINYKECMILTEKLVFELIVAAKQNIDNKSFEDFYKSLSK